MQWQAQLGNYVGKVCCEVMLVIEQDPPEPFVDTVFLVDYQYGLPQPLLCLL